MQEPSKSDQTPDELNAEFDAIVEKEKQVDSGMAEPDSVPVTVRRGGSSAPEVAVPVIEKVSDTQTSSPALVKAAHAENTPATLVLQWLTYAFWGWFALAMTWLVAIVVGWLVDRDGFANDIADALPYPLAATIILLLIALSVDFFYSRLEPIKKRGAASVLMIIHTVIFALCGIAALIAVVFGAIYSALNGGSFGGTNGSRVVITTGAVMLVVYALLVLRTLFGAPRRIVRFVTWGVLAAIFLGASLVGVFGPMADSLATKQDRLIEAALPELARNIESHTQRNDRLPATLSEAINTGSSYRRNEVKELVSQNLVRYTPNTKPSTGGGDPIKMTDPKLTPEPKPIGIDDTLYSDKVFYYRLCVTYKREKSSSYDYDYSEPVSSSSSYISTLSHPAGEKCYDLQVGDYRVY